MNYRCKHLAATAASASALTACLHFLSSAPHQQMNYRYKHLVNALIVAGWDDQEGGQARAGAGGAGSGGLALLPPCAAAAVAGGRCPTQPLNTYPLTTLPHTPNLPLPAGVRRRHRRHHLPRALDHRRQRQHLPVGLP